MLTYTEHTYVYMYVSEYMDMCTMDYKYFSQLKIDQNANCLSLCI